MGRAQAGDREAFELLVERYAADTYRLAAAIVGEVDARDVTQETFVKAWQELARLRDWDAFPAWLRRICVRRSRNWVRALERRGRPTSLDANAALADQLRDPKRDFRLAVEARIVLEPTFDRLNADQRVMLALHYSVGFSITEAADLLGIRVGTAKSRLNSGLGALRAAVASAELDPRTEAAS